MKRAISPEKAAFLVMISVFMLLATVQGALSAPSAYYDFNDEVTDQVGSNDLTTGISYSSDVPSFNQTGGGGSKSGSFSGTNYAYTTTSWINGTGDLTINFWFKRSAVSSQENFMSKYQGASSNRISIYMTSTGTVAVFGQDGSTGYTIETSTDYDNGTWHMFSFVGNYTDGTGHIFIDGTKVAVTTTVWASTGDLDAGVGHTIGTYRNHDNYFFQGLLDEWKVYTDKLSTAEVVNLYNCGDESGCAGGSNASTWGLYVDDLYDDSDLSGVTVTFDTGCTNTTDASGFAQVTNETAGCTALSGTLSGVTIAKTGYIANDTTFSVAENGTANAGMYQKKAQINATKLITGAYFNESFNITTGGGKIYANGTDVYSLTGNNNFTFSSTGWYNTTAEINVTASTGYTLSGVYDALLRVTAKDYWTNASINTFTVNASNATYAFETSHSTTNGTVKIPGIQGIDFFLYMDATGYALANTTTNLTNSTPSYEFTLYTTNSVTIYFFDEYSGGPITQNVTVEFSGPNSTFESSTTGGYLYEDLLDPGTWTLTLNSAGYDERIYYITVSARSHQVLNTYLLNSTLSADTTFYIKDADGNNLPNSTVTMQDNINGSWVTIAQKTTDFFGIAYFPLQYAHTYKAIIESPGYITKAAEFERVKTEYTIRLSSENTQSYTTYADEFTYSLSPSEAKPEQTNFTMSTSSPSGALEWFATRVLLNGSYTLTNNSGSPSGGTATVTLNLTAYQGYYATVWYMAKSTGIDDPLIIEREFYIFGQTPGNYTLSSFASHYDAELSSEEDEGKTFKAVMVTIAAVGAALALGLAISISAGSLTAAGVFILGGAVGWMSWSYVIITAGGLILTAFLGRVR